MKFPKETFDKVLTYLRQIPNSAYDPDGRLFIGGEGTEFPEFTESQIEESSGFSLTSSYIVYATIRAKTLPLEHGMITSLMDGSREMEPPENCRMPCAYHSRLGSHFCNPLDILAIETIAKPGIRDKWDIWMVRDRGDSQGYINDSVVKVLTNRQS